MEDANRHRQDDAFRSRLLLDSWSGVTTKQQQQGKEMTENETWENSFGKYATTRPHLGFS
jgi:hypothetical protein